MDTDRVDYLYAHDDWSFLPVVFGVFLIVAVSAVIWWSLKDDTEQAGSNQSDVSLFGMSRATVTAVFLVLVALVLTVFSFVYKDQRAEAREQMEFQKILQHHITRSYDVAAAHIHFEDAKHEDVPENTPQIYHADIVLENPHTVVEATVYYDEVKQLVFLTPDDATVEFEVRDNSRLAEYIADHEE